MSIETMKQALEALERAAELLTRVGLCFKGIDKAITSLRQAITEAEKRGVSKTHEWVGLTDYEVLDLWRKHQDVRTFYREIEAELKEKNT